MTIEALVCFGILDRNDYYSQDLYSCDIFDCSSGESCTSSPTFDTAYPHYWGGLGLHDGQPVTVGSSVRVGGDYDYRNVERLTEDGWYDNWDNDQ